MVVGCSRNMPELDDFSEHNARVHDTHLVVSANYHASKIGRDILRRGGNAMDAAVATKIALTFSEPHETGLGGGGFLLYYDADSGQQYVYDGRETAPAAAHANWFRVMGVPLHHYLAVTTGRSIGVPGMIAMLHKAHEAHGELPWEDLFTPTIEIAEQGIPMPPRIQRQVASDYSLRLFTDMRSLITRPAGADDPRLSNPDLAESLRGLASEGPALMYQGELGAAYRERAQGRWPMRARLSEQDFADYEAVARDLVCGSYRGWRVCGAPPPSSGGITLLQILGMLEPFDVPSMSPDSPEFLHLYAEASRLAFADRQYHIADPEFTVIDTEGLIDSEYLLSRSSLINKARAMTQANPGVPGVAIEFEDAPPVQEELEYGTSHLSTVDGRGNAVALTGSIEAPFGVRMAAGGILLNNQLTDFDFMPRRNGLPVANRVEPGKRPRSSMTPTFIFNEAGELTYVIGSRGGSRIIGYVAKTVIGMLDWGLSMQSAIDLPNVLHRGERLEIEADTLLEERIDALRELGHRVSIETLDSGVHGIQRVDEGWRGAADKRMEGAVYGD